MFLLEGQVYCKTARVCCCPSEMPSIAEAREFQRILRLPLLELIRWLHDVNLLSKKIACHQCDCDMRLIKNTNRSTTGK